MSVDDDSHISPPPPGRSLHRKVSQSTLFLVPILMKSSPCLRCHSIKEVLFHTVCSFHLLTCSLFWQVSDHCICLLWNLSKTLGFIPGLVTLRHLEKAPLSMWGHGVTFGGPPGLPVPPKSCAYACGLASGLQLLGRRHLGG